MSESAPTSPRFRFALWLVLSLLPGCASSGPLPTPSRELSLASQGYQLALKNGLRAFHHGDTTTNLVDVTVRYGVGSRDDPPGKSGLAHLVEHLSYTQQLDGDRRLYDELIAVSVGINATTTWDSTDYMSLGLQDDLERLLELEATRMTRGCAGLDEGAVAREREVVLNELRARSLGTGSLAHQLHALAYPENHPYHVPPGGHEAEVAALTLDDVCRFMTEHYDPARATVVVSGNVSRERAQQAINATFSAIKSSVQNRPPSTQAITSRGYRLEANSTLRDPAVVAIFPLPPRFDSDEHSIELFRQLLEVFLRSRAQQEDELLEAGVVELGGARSPALGLYMSYSVTSHHAYAEKALREALDQARSASANPFIELFVYRPLRRELLADVTRQFERLDTRGVAIAEYLDAPEGYGFFQGDVASVNKAVFGRIFDASSWWFDWKRAGVVVLRPGGGAEGSVSAGLRVNAAPHREGASIHARDSVDDARSPLRIPPTTSLAAKTRRFELENGLDVLLIPTSSMPSAELRLVFGSGERAAPTDQPYLAQFSAILLDPSAEVDATTTTFRASGLATEIDRMIESLASRVIEGTYDSELIRSVAKSARELQTSREQLREARLRAAYRQALYRAESNSAAASIPPLEALGGLQAGSVRRFKRHHYQAANATLIVTGGFSADVAEAHIRRHFGRRSLERAIERWSYKHDPAPQVAPSMNSAVGVHVGLVDPRALQTYVTMLLPLDNALDDQLAARLVLAEMLDAAVQELRFAKGVSYTLEASLNFDDLRPAYNISGDIDPLRTHELIPALESAFKQVTSGPEFEVAFAGARRRVVRRLIADASDSRSVADQAEFVVKHGLPLDMNADLARLVSSLRPDQVRQVAQAELSFASASFLWTGSSASIDRAYAGRGVVAELIR